VLVCMFLLIFLTKYRLYRWFASESAHIKPSGAGSRCSEAMPQSAEHISEIAGKSCCGCAIGHGVLCRADAVAANWTFLTDTPGFELVIKLEVCAESLLPSASAGSVSISCHRRDDPVDPELLKEDSVSLNVGRNGGEE
jgi:hypothetical protein